MYNDSLSKDFEVVENDDKPKEIRKYGKKINQKIISIFIQQNFFNNIFKRTINCIILTIFIFFIKNYIFYVLYPKFDKSSLAYIFK